MLLICLLSNIQHCRYTPVKMAKRAPGQDTSLVKKLKKVKREGWHKRKLGG